jgi:hypothetical protein
VRIIATNGPSPRSWRSVSSLILNRGALADPAHTLPRDIWDPSLVAYLIAWDGHALLHNPGAIWISTRSIRRHTVWPTQTRCWDTRRSPSWAPVRTRRCSATTCSTSRPKRSCCSGATSSHDSWGSVGLRAGSSASPWRSRRGGSPRAGHLQIPLDGRDVPGLGYAGPGPRHQMAARSTRPTTNEAGVGSRRMAGRDVAAHHRIAASACRSSTFSSAP